MKRKIQQCGFEISLNSTVSNLAAFSMGRVASTIPLDILPLAGVPHPPS